LLRPRAIAIDAHDLLYIADFTGRIQVFDRDGAFQRGWSTPTIINGRPAGIAVGRDGNILVADSHYSRVLIYTPDGQLVREITGAADEGPGPFIYVSDVVQDADGYFYITEYGEEDRIRKLSPEGRYLKHWGSHGNQPGQLVRPRAIVVGPDGYLYVADACNHRIQVFDRDGALIRCWGRQGAGPGELGYPYDLAFGPNGDLYVVEFGNHRVQRFTSTGEWKGLWGSAGREPGCLNSPWGLAVDSKGGVQVLDTDNHRVQRVVF
jgi:DNA-binding beta-propeller fold protein YncE